MKQLTLILSFLVSANAWAEWTRIGEVKIQGGRYAIYVDLASISWAGRIATMWGMYDFNVPKFLTGKGDFRSIKFKNEFDCGQGRLFLGTPPAWEVGSLFPPPMPAVNGWLLHLEVQTNASCRPLATRNS